MGLHGETASSSKMIRGLLLLVVLAVTFSAPLDSTELQADSKADADLTLQDRAHRAYSCLYWPGSCSRYQLGGSNKKRLEKCRRDRGKKGQPSRRRFYWTRCCSKKYTRNKCSCAQSKKE